MSFETKEINETPQPKEEQEVQVKEAPEKKSDTNKSDNDDGLKVKDEPEKESEKTDSDNDGLKVKEEPAQNGSDVTAKPEKSVEDMNTREKLTYFKEHPQETTTNNSDNDEKVITRGTDPRENR